ncbi:hypothetical protein Dalk_3019 [Desulfatibacillum aliphaticivorans]|uniref:Uncharacterized protein n=1 Tax=Desulfatibacillum aliphaticivorans TaxID=218208 RepID=B8FL74_DESAL|nr:hypothetical protein Dalk_3019 [Desulfatibacillum aliphaticivorans]
MWPTTLICTVVSKEVKDVFINNEITGVNFRKVDIDGIGKHEPWDDYPVVDDSIAMLDLVELTEKEEDPEQYGPLYQMVILFESGYPPGIKIVNRCRKCGYIEIDNEDMEISLSSKTVPEADIFFLKSTRYIVVSDKVKLLMEKSNFSNVSFQKVGWDS